MDISEKQAKWKQERPLFEAEFIHSHLLPFFNFNENTGDYEIKSEYENDEDHESSFNVLNTGWVMWLRAKRDAKAQAVPEKDAVIKKLSDQLYAQEMKASAARVLCETACELLDGYAHQDAMVILNDLEQAMKEPAND